MTTQTQAQPATLSTPRIESLLSSRLFLAPHLEGDRIFFVSNMAGALSLYAMNRGGSVPEPLLPPHIALQNPELIEGYPYWVFAELGSILVMLDHDGDEHYQPMRIPLDGGIPLPWFGNAFEGYNVLLIKVVPEHSRCYFLGQSRTESMMSSFLADIGTGEIEKLGESPYGSWVAGASGDASTIVLADGYTAGDHVLYLWRRGEGERRLLYGKPIEQRHSGEAIKPNGVSTCHFIRGDRGLLCVNAIFDDRGSLGYLELVNPDEVAPVSITGLVHTGDGELVELDHVHADRYALTYNVDGASWIYECELDETGLELRVTSVLCGCDELSDGVAEGLRYDPGTDAYSLSFSTATSPTQLYIIEGARRAPVVQTRERILGIPSDVLAQGEDASFTSHDGLRISARLYLPSKRLAYAPPYPIVVYIHGGPQGQERPNFAWFSIPMIQFLTLNGFAVFVPNARGSSGYGLEYMKRVDHDWGGQDRLDHVHAMTVLAGDERLDTSRAGVMGRSYGGYMTLTLAFRHPELWSAAVDMFGPYNLETFQDRVPEAWKLLTRLAIGDPQTEPEFVRERSPFTYRHELRCPMLVIQGANDPRVIEQESRDLVEELRRLGKAVEYLVFEDEGHDVLKFRNRVRCYNAIVDFFKQHL